MTITRKFRTTVFKRLQSEPYFRRSMLAGDMECGKAILRDYLQPSLGFAEPPLKSHTPQPTKARSPE